jgi:hypothetical protein
LVSEKLFEKIMKNKDYCKFSVVATKTLVDNYGEDVVSQITGISGLKAQVGTLQAIGNPFKETYLQDLVIFRAVARNEALLTTVNYLKGNEEITGIKVSQTKRGADGKFLEAGGDMRTVYLKEDGKLQAYDFSKGVADELLSSPVPVGDIWGALKTLSNVQRQLLTIKNPAFQPRNALRDIQQYYINIPGSILSKFMSARTAAKEIRHFNRTGEASPNLRHLMMERGLLSGHGYDKHNVWGEDKILNDAIAQYGNNEAARRRGILRTMYNWLGFMDDLLLFEERTAKLAGYIQLKKKFPGMDDAERLHMTRTMVGTSDIASGGKHTWLTNVSMPYSNSTLQGWYAAVEAMKRDPKGYWFRMGISTFASKCIMALAGRGLLTAGMRRLGMEADTVEELERMYAVIPDYYKGRFDPLPIGLTEDGRVIFVVLPKAFEAQLLGEALFSAINQSLKGDFEGAVQGVAKATLAQFPIAEASIMPFIKVAGAFIDRYAYGRNPYDSFRKRNVISRGNFKGNRLEEFKEMTGWGFRAIGGRVVWIPPTDGKTWGDRHWVENAAHIPIVGNPWQAFIRVSRESIY